MDLNLGRKVGMGLALAVCFTFGSLAALAQEPEKDKGKLAKQVREKLQKADYDWLDSTAEKLRQGPFDPLETTPPIGFFYYAFEEDLPNEAATEKRLAELQAWHAARPDSLTARTALGELFIHSAWQARGSGWASTVSSEGWKNFANCLDQAAVYLYNEPPEPESQGVQWVQWVKPIRQVVSDRLHFPIIWALGRLPLEDWLTAKPRNLDPVKDPANMAARIVLAMGQSDPKAMSAAFKGGTAEYPTYFPLYERQQRFLLPRWLGEPGQGAQAAAVNANTLEGPQSDAFYTLLADGVLGSEKMDFFEKSDFDIERMLRGYDYLIKVRKDNWPPYYRNRAAFVAAAAGQTSESLRRLMESGPIGYPEAWLGQKNLAEMMEKIGFAEAMRPAEVLEASGKLTEAQAAYLAFTPGKPSNGWLKPFAMRNNLPELYASFPGSVNPDKPIEKCSLNEVHELLGFLLPSGDLDKLRQYATFFDSKRPWNFTGKAALYLIATLEGDPAAMASAKQAIVDFKSDRRNYQIGINYLKGSVGWAEAIKEMQDDGYRIQAITIMAVHALAQGKVEESRHILDAMGQEYPMSAMSAFGDSLRIGALYRKFNPWGLPKE